MSEIRLEEALTHEREGRFLESFRDCLRLLGENPRNAPALALASRLSMLAADTANAIAYACEAVRAEPANDAARRAFEVACQSRRSTAGAVERYAQALNIAPDVARHIAIPGSLPAIAETDSVHALLDEALKIDPGFAQAHAAIGNLCTRRAEYLTALGAYQRAAFISGRAEYALALSEILFTLNEHRGAAYYRDRALAKQQLFAPPPMHGARIKVAALMAPGPWPVNAPLDFVIDPARVSLSRLYLTDAPIDTERLDGYDAVFNAIGESQEAQAPIAQAKRLATALKKRVLNDPGQSWKTSRVSLAGALRAVPRCTVPAASRLTRAGLRSWTVFPALARPIDAHGGRGLVKLDDARSVAAYLRERQDPQFDVTPFVEYRSTDGFYRKYRVALAGGTPYPYHLAISPEWMVHYIGSPTSATPWMQAEEERFLSDPRSVFPSFDETFGGIAKAIGLDYFAVDCSLLPDGRVLVFEADIASLIHCRESAGSYKYRYVPKIFSAFERLLSSLI